MGLPFNPEYGLIAVFSVVLVQQLGAPLPVLPVMLVAGAQSARDPVFGARGLDHRQRAVVLGRAALRSSRAEAHLPRFALSR